MGLWIKEPAAEEVTGTVVMIATEHDAESIDSALPEQKTTSQGVVLNPQPHDNPNDPLNWPIWRRDLSLVVIGIYSFIVGSQTPLLAPMMSRFIVEFHTPLHTLTYLVGGLMMSMGIGSLIFAPLAVLYGKRLIYLVSQLVFFAGCFWGANANSFGSLMGARVLTGIGAGPAESLPSSTLAEIYFAHERAYRTGIYTMLLLGGKNLSPLATGFISENLGWHWIYWILAIIIGTCFVCTFLFVHETWWDRTPIPNKRSLKESELAKKAREQMHRPRFEDMTPQHLYSSERVQTTHGIIRDDASTVHTSENSTPKKEAPAEDLEMVDLSKSVSGPTLHERRPFWQNLAVYTGRKTTDPYWMVVLRPFCLYLYPPVLYSTLIYSTSVVWLSVIAETISSIFTSPPYNFPITSIGLLYIATFTGSCLGSSIAGKLSDIISRKMSRMNGGVYEPEFRLLMIFPVMIAVTIGLMGFGWSTFDKDAWIVPAIMLGFVGFGTSLGSTVAITYAVDCYKKFAAESLVALNFSKNTLGLVFGIFVPLFLAKSGLKVTYVVYGSVEVGLCLLAIPLYRYGKTIRAFCDVHDPMRHLYR